MADRKPPSSLCCHIVAGTIVAAVVGVAIAVLLLELLEMSELLELP